MRLSRTQGRNIRTSDSSPYTLSGGSDLPEFSIVRAVAAINPWKVVNIALTGEVTASDSGVQGRPGQQVVVTPANAGVTTLAHGGVVGIYEGQGGRGAEVTDITLVALTTALPALGNAGVPRAAVTGDVLEICTRGPSFVHAWDNTTDASGAINTGDIIGVPHATAGTSGVCVYIGDHSTLHLVGRIISLERNTVTSTTSSAGMLTKCLLHT